MPQRKVFICYRRSDSEAVSGALARDLRDRLGKESVFRDKDDIEAGAKWLDRLEEQISMDSALLVLIGTDWVGHRGTVDSRRIDDPGDIVRKEIRLALEKKAHLFPILLEHAQIPTDLPEDISELVTYNAWWLRDDNWDNDLRRIIAGLDRIGYRKRRAHLLTGVTSGVALVVVVVAISGAQATWKTNIEAESAHSGNPQPWWGK